jgi:hypothetical protein
MKRLVLLTTVIVLLFAGASDSQEHPAEPATDFDPPIRLKADGKIIDSGPDWGHCGPCIEDLDGDGLDDLIVGDFGGKFRYYRNVGTAEAPEYAAGELIQAGGVDAEVNIYCCVGSQPRFGDLDGDGLRDMISNSYDPGHVYLFGRLEGTRFAAREEIVDKSGRPVRLVPDQKLDYQSFGSFFELVDWEGDGDLDLLIGSFQGELLLRKNEGTPTEPAFAVNNIDVQAEGKPLRVTSHLCPDVADWDGDGRWDIIAGSDDGSVSWFRNVGNPQSPAFAAPQVLVPPHDGNGYYIVRWSDQEVVPGIRSQVEVTDYNRDGKLDLLVGDFYSAYHFRADLSADQKAEVQHLVDENKKIRRNLTEKLDALQAEFNERYPGDTIFTEKADQEWVKAYQAFREGPEAQQLDAAEPEFVAKMRPFLASTDGTGDKYFYLAKPHGHVWLYLRQ